MPPPPTPATTSSSVITRVIPPAIPSVSPPVMPQAMPGGQQPAPQQQPNHILELECNSNLSSTSSGYIYDRELNRRILTINSRERAVDRQETLLAERERAVATRERLVADVYRQKALVRKIDLWLSIPRDSRELFIDPKIVCYALNEHPFLYLNDVERRRINTTRAEIDAMRESYYSQQLNEQCCPICFDGISTTQKRIIALECGHVYCLECVDRMQLAAREQALQYGRDPLIARAHCGECNMVIDTSRSIRLFFAQRG